MTAASTIRSFAQRLRSQIHQNWKNHLGTVALVLLVFLGVHGWQTRDVPSGPLPELPFILLQPDGSLVETTLNSWRNAHPDQAVAVHIWAEWCPICKTEEHSISQLSANKPVLTVAMQSGTADQVQRVLMQRQLPWTTAIDARGELARALGFKAVPAFVVIDAQGRLRMPTVGYTTELGMRWRLWWAGLL